jgi:uracil DNA glycosylase
LLSVVTLIAVISLFSLSFPVRTSILLAEGCQCVGARLEAITVELALEAHQVFLLGWSEQGLVLLVAVLEAVPEFNFTISFFTE